MRARRVAYCSLLLSREHEKKDYYYYYYSVYVSIVFSSLTKLYRNGSFIDLPVHGIELKQESNLSDVRVNR